MTDREARDILSDPPYVWPGGKGMIADKVWARLGDVTNFVEPFFGGGAVWRLRPHWPFDDRVIRRETINDADGNVANFWRSVQADPDGVAAAADWMVSELDLHARGDWLYCKPEAAEFVARMRADPDYFDARRAGVWCWFVANWIGGLPAVEKNAHRTEDSVYKRRPHLGRAGKGVSRQLPHLGRAGKGVSRQLPHLGGAGQGVSRQRPGDGDGTCERARAALTVWMRTLADRMRHVRVCCGDWERVCGPSPTFKCGSPCGVFLDPPYSAEAGRDSNLYSVESLTVAHDVRAWCLANGDNPELRIALCGYEGEGHEELERHGWSVLAWKAGGGYGRQRTNGEANENSRRERTWFSPHCLRERTLFDLEAQS